MHKLSKAWWSLKIESWKCWIWDIFEIYIPWKFVCIHLYEYDLVVLLDVTKIIICCQLYSTCSIAFIQCNSSSRVGCCHHFISVVIMIFLVIHVISKSNCIEQNYNTVYSQNHPSNAYNVVTSEWEFTKFIIRVSCYVVFFITSSNDNTSIGTVFT